MDPFNRTTKRVRNGKMLKPEIPGGSDRLVRLVSIPCKHVIEEDPRGLEQVAVETSVEMLWMAGKRRENWTKGGIGRYLKYSLQFKKLRSHPPTLVPHVWFQRTI